MDFASFLEWPNALFTAGYAVSLVATAVWASRFLRLPEMQACRRKTPRSGPSWSAIADCPPEQGPAATRLTPERQIELLASARRVTFALKAVTFASFIGFAAQRHPDRPGQLTGAFALYFVVMLIQSQMIFRVERKIRNITATGASYLALSVRGLAAMLAMYAVYILLASSGMTAAVRLGTALELSPAARTLLSVVAFPIALLLGLSVLTLLSPLFVRLMMPAKKLTDPALVATLEGCFRKVGLPIPSFWTLELRRHQVHNAMVSGARWGRGPFRQALFLTADLTEKMTAPELEAIVLHEISHFSLKHIRKRVLWSVVAICTSLPIALLVSVAAHLCFGGGPYSGLLALAAIFGTQISLMRRVVRKQELEADENAVKLGAGVEALGSALHKLARLNGQQAHRKDPSSWFSIASAHPPATERLAFITERQRNGFPPLPGDFRLALRYLKAHSRATATACVLAAFGIGYGIRQFEKVRELPVITQLFKKQTRAPASETAAPSGAPDRR